MAETTTQSITIAAGPEQIMAVIADFPAYPDWAGAVRAARVVAQRPDGRASEVCFELDAGMFSDTYTLAYEWAPHGLSVSWRLVSGRVQKAQQGSYVLEPAGGETTVTYSLSVELNIPMIGMLRRKAEKIIIDTALKELKRRVEG
jgi:ribosome-associated toxin RatA of RatAB toxin-antitoxin module